MKIFQCSVNLSHNWPYIHMTQ